MAGWNDLPTELKALIVELIDESGTVRDGTTAPSSEERRALLALSGMERALYALTGPMLWETLMLGTRSLACVQAFGGAVSSERCRLVRTVDCRRDRFDFDRTLQAKIAKACVQALKRTPNVKELRLDGPGSVWVKRLPSLPKLMRKVRTLNLKTVMEGNLSAADTSAILGSFDKLVDISLPSSIDDEDQLVLSQLQALESLRKLDLGCPMHSGDELHYPILSQPWSGRLTFLSLSMWIDEPTLRSLLHQIGSTLKSFQYANAMDPSSSAPLLPYNLPVLEHLGLVTAWDGAFELCSAFSNAPLEVMWTSRGDCYYESDLDLLGGVVEQHSSTLEVLEIRLGDGDEELGEALDRLAAKCKDKQVRFNIVNLWT
ncbi:hypothetical protein BCR35DRAFT_333839 [Leucosporidium creatinivorum]|uniref:F-box domain-containing protein n=1 Tax=Leucosporidium creatinivorum TaxID=106004 RepID=A0A1Y2EMV0_9BASI|nr:hypothetical protein BCR35DRAFT_333839 [Leucosporidium creatinivorum]